MYIHTSIKNIMEDVLLFSIRINFSVAMLLSLSDYIIVSRQCGDDSYI